MDTPSPVKTGPAAESVRNRAPSTSSTTLPSSKRSFLSLRVGLSILLFLIILGMGLAAFVYLGTLKVPPPLHAPAPVTLRVEVFEVEATPLDRFLLGFGTSRADRKVVISAEVMGRVTQVENLHVGRRVEGPTAGVEESGNSFHREGEIIVQIDPQTYEERLEQAQAVLDQDEIALERLQQEHVTSDRLLEQQKTRMETIQKTYDRRRDLLSQRAGSELQVENTRLEVEQYRETLIKLENDLELYPVREREIQVQQNAHRNDLRLAELELEKATVRAPFSGLLSDVLVEEGQYVKPGDALVEITDSDRIEIPIPLSISRAASLEQLIAQGISPAAELARREEDFTSPTSQTWKGRVTRVAPVADEQTRTLDVFVEVDNREQTTPLRPGTFVYARVAAGSVPASAGVLIPRDTILDGQVYVVGPPKTVEITEPASGEEEGKTVKVTYPQARQTPVLIAETFQSFALIAEGLKPGDQVVMTNLDIIQESTLLDVRATRHLDEEFLRLRFPLLERADETDESSE